jgi:hypothetical protein
VQSLQSLKKHEGDERNNMMKWLARRQVLRTSATLLRAGNLRLRVES